MSESSEARWYGVSHGNGNDGVSHVFPDYYVKTAEPYRLAELATLHTLNEKFLEWGIENVYVDGEADYGIAATFTDPPDDQQDYEQSVSYARHVVTDAENELREVMAREQTAAAPDLDAIRGACDDVDTARTELESLEDEDPGSWSDANGAWHVTEVFPVDESDTEGGAPRYESLEERFGAAFLVHVEPESVG